MESIAENSLYFLRVPPSIYNVLPSCLSLTKSLLDILNTIQSNRNQIFKNFAQEILFEFQLKVQSLSDLIGDDPLRDSILARTIDTVGLESPDFNVNYVAFCLGTCLEFIKPLKEPFEQMARQSLNLSTMESCQVHLKRLKLAMSFLEIAAKNDQDDLFLKNPNDHGIKDFAQIIKVRVLGTDEELQKSKKKMMKMVYASLAVGQYFKNKPETKINHIRKYTKFIYYLANSSEAAKKAEMASVEEGSHLYDIFNQLGTNFLDTLNELEFPSIPYVEDFYIPREYPEITLKVVQDALKNGSWSKKDKPLFQDYDFQLCLKSSKTLDDLKKKDENSVEIRLLVPMKYPFKNKTDSIDNIIIHIHGGGFVSMTAKSHDIYTRTWAKQTNAAIFSINYRLAPQNPYPAAIDDIWQAYNWIIDHSEKYFSIKPKKVVVVGDSAGGNLNFALNLLLCKNKRRLPNGVQFMYPTCNMEPDHFTPSFFGSVKDTFVSKAYANVIRVEYLTDKYMLRDPLASPIYAPDEALVDFPPCKIFVMENDPFHDDGLNMAYRLFKLKKQVNVYSYKGMCHAVLNFDRKTIGVPEPRIIVEEAADMLKELLNN